VGGAGIRSEFYLTNVEGTRNVIKACEAAGVARLVRAEFLSLKERDLRKQNIDIASYVAEEASFFFPKSLERNMT
jgi:hypothetical protein